MLLAIIVAIIVIGLLTALFMVLRHKGEIDLNLNIRKGELNVKKK
jgi:hypothetical protein